MSYLIIHLKIGGLCNRLRAMVSGKILADVIKREFKVFWEPHPRCHCLVNDLFENIPQIDASQLDPKSGLYYTISSPDAMKEIEAHKNKKMDIHIQSLMTFKPTMMSHSEFKVRFRQELQALKPIQEIEQRVFSDVKDMIGLHIRRGDHWRATRYSPLSFFVKMIDKHLAKEPITKFFVCSDSHFAREHLKAEYGERICFYDNIDLNRHSTEGMQAALLDFLNLSKTRQIYRSFASSFGDVASKVHGIPIDTVSLKNSPKTWNAYWGDFWIDRLLCWDEHTEHWKIKKMKGKLLFMKPMALLVLVRCNFFCSKRYQLSISQRFNDRRKGKYMIWF